MHMVRGVRSLFPGVVMATAEVIVSELIVDTGGTDAGDACRMVVFEIAMYRVALGRRWEDGRLSLGGACQHTIWPKCP